MGGGGRGGASNGGSVEVADAEEGEHGVDKESIFGYQQGWGECRQGSGAN